MRQDVLSQVDAERLSWRDRLGEIDGDRARAAAAVEKSHACSQMRREERGDLSRAAREYGTVPFIVDPVWSLGPRRRLGHARTSTFHRLPKPSEAL